MSFIACVFCKTPIQEGEQILSDVDMKLAHKACVERELNNAGFVTKKKIAPFLAQPVQPPPPPLPPPPVVEPSLLPSAPKLCVECQKPAISMCPCGAIVHQDFGYNGSNCSGRHEAKCEKAWYSREPISDLEKTGIIIGGGLVLSRNGEIKEFHVSANGGTLNGKTSRVNRKKRGRK